MAAVFPSARILPRPRIPLSDGGRRFFFQKNSKKNWSRGQEARRKTPRSPGSTPAEDGRGISLREALPPLEPAGSRRWWRGCGGGGVSVAVEMRQRQRHAEGIGFLLKPPRMVVMAMIGGFFSLRVGRGGDAAVETRGGNRIPPQPYGNDRRMVVMVIIRCWWLW